MIPPKPFPARSPYNLADFRQFRGLAPTLALSPWASISLLGAINATPTLNLTYSCNSFYTWIFSWDEWGSKDSWKFMEGQKDQCIFPNFIPFDSPFFNLWSKKIAFYRGSSGGSRSPRSPRSHWSWRVGGRVLLKVKCRFSRKVSSNLKKQMPSRFFFRNLFFHHNFEAWKSSGFFSWHKSGKIDL